MLSPKQTKFHLLRYVNICSSAAMSGDIRELTRRVRRRQRGLHFKIRVRVIHITTKLFHVVSR